MLDHSDSSAITNQIVPACMTSLTYSATRHAITRSAKGRHDHLCTFPTMLYLLLKNVYHSSSTVFSLSPRSSYSGLQSSSLRDDCANARDASFPAKTEIVKRRSLIVLQNQTSDEICVKLTHRDRHPRVHKHLSLTRRRRFP